jgi:hypothetical protein
MNHSEEEERRRRQLELWRSQEEKRRLDELEMRRQEFEARIKSQEAQKQRLIEQTRKTNLANQKQLEEEKKRAALRKKENQIKLAQKKETEQKKKDGLGTEAMERAMAKPAAPDRARTTFIKAKRVLPTGLRMEVKPGSKSGTTAVGGSGCLVIFSFGVACALAGWRLIVT